MQISRNRHCQKLKDMATLCVLLATSTSALAAPIDPMVVITGSVNLDGNTLAPVDGNQTATYSATSGGAALPDLVCAVNCVNGSANASGYSGVSLTDTGDGVGITTTVSGSGAFAFNEFFLNDYNINLTNNSVTDTFLIRFDVFFEHDASVTADGAAKTTLDIDREQPLPATNELFSFGNLDTTLSMADPFSDSGVLKFDVTLAPGMSGLVEGRQDIEGIALNGGSYAINQEMFISVHKVINLNTIPVPAAVWLFASGLIGLAGMGIRRSRA